MFFNHVVLVDGFPGFGIALVAFSVFVMAENIHRKGKHRAVEGVRCDELHNFNCGGALTYAS